MYWTTINTAPNSSSFDLPDEGTPVVIKLPSDREFIARLFCNEFKELVWQFKDGSYALVCEYTQKQMQYIETKPKIKEIPLAWRPLEASDLYPVVLADIKNIGSIYPTVGAALYDEPVNRLAQRIATNMFNLFASKT